MVGSEPCPKYSVRVTLANTQAYYNTAKFTAVKGFKVQAPAANAIKLF
jgi:hypothetical protein